MIGIGVGIDYALFISTRYREACTTAPIPNVPSCTRSTPAAAPCCSRAGPS
jgi:uncharacterized membrane protein YdfJ with MMPL/SSD domain